MASFRDVGAGPARMAERALANLRAAPDSLSGGGPAGGGAPGGAALAAALGRRNGVPRRREPQLHDSTRARQGTLDRLCAHDGASSRGARTPRHPRRTPRKGRTAALREEDFRRRGAACQRPPALPRHPPFFGGSRRAGNAPFPAEGHGGGKVRALGALGGGEPVGGPARALCGD